MLFVDHEGPGVANEDPAVRAAWIVVTGLDGSGKSTLVASLAKERVARQFRLPYHTFVRPALAQSGSGLPFGDVHTDRLLFALDARLANYAIREFRGAGVDLVSQRGWMDNFIFGAVQGVTYEQTEAMLRSTELERPSAHIFLIAEPAVALRRIQETRYRDKYETAQFIALQYGETKRFFEAVKQGIPALQSFANIPAVLIDTTDMNLKELHAQALGFLTTLNNPCRASVPKTA
jgi:thymidylate kinase